MVIFVLHDSPGHADRPGGKVYVVPCHREQLRPAERVQREHDRKRRRCSYGGVYELRYLLWLNPFPRVRV